MSWSWYNPQTNVQAEQSNQDLGAALCCVSAKNPSSWSTHLAWIEYSHNSLPSTATSISPFECSMGYQSLSFQLRRLTSHRLSSHRYNLTSIDVPRLGGIFVWLSSKTVSKKTVLSIINPTVVKLKLSSHMKVHPTLMFLC